MMIIYKSLSATLFLLVLLGGCSPSETTAAPTPTPMPEHAPTSGSDPEPTPRPEQTPTPEPTGTLQVTVYRLDPGTNQREIYEGVEVTIYLQVDDGVERTVGSTLRTNRDGVAVFENLAADWYRVHARDRAVSREKLVQVRANDDPLEATIELPRALPVLFLTPQESPTSPSEPVELTPPVEVAPQ